MRSMMGSPSLGLRSVNASNDFGSAWFSRSYMSIAAASAFSWMSVVSFR